MHVLGPALSDTRWASLMGGYRVPYDPRPALRRLEQGDASAWDELWNELHHQGDIGEASFAALPGLVRIHQQRGIADWNTYAIAAIIELARDGTRNPPIPDDLKPCYEAAWRHLADIGLRELVAADDPVLVNGILGVIAIAKGQRTIGRLAIMYTEDERIDLLADYF
ncbi:hypothetical protein SSBR45G_39100 [Bradyrhizobium sp. SSBR45G]|uniref:hypothetical protein n=1 Tax=unclassified Bradyrhizobium TaxID=2631580 RepID=UPI002342BB9C|nr:MULTISPECIES: hypothetical protein [unclassified Bradyrhizobium]GLH79001.1 hypothetical protein SSBR45G_39100 [Bradyrhizobium sp. SSBR45G]GLH85323.1 hypothetical protein SSBR45R_27830 [Bradyrhizobium sp. SSBR45R]